MCAIVHDITLEGKLRKRIQARMVCLAGVPSGGYHATSTSSRALLQSTVGHGPARLNAVAVALREEGIDSGGRVARGRSREYSGSFIGLDHL